MVVAIGALVLAACGEAGLLDGVGDRTREAVVGSTTTTLAVDAVPAGNADEAPFGKVFGFVFVGYSVGVSAAPILFGWFLDAGQPDSLFILAAAFALLALAATAGAQHMSGQVSKPT